MNAAAQFRSVSQKFGDFTAVDAIDLEIPRGKFTTLLGPSGCGKTTSLRMLAGYLRPTSGQVLISGKDCTTVPPEKRNLGMVFQSYALFPHMTIGENVGYGLKIRKVGAEERKRKVKEALEMVGLAHLTNSKPKQLSGGQQQRVAIARAIAIEPELLLLDEPLSNLDARLRIQMRAEIRRIQTETHLSVVLVTHDQDEALEMSDQMIVMKDGTIQQQGSPTEVFPHPANAFVAEFLGYENFIPANGQTLTVRPEHLRLSRGGDSSETGAALSLDGTVTNVAYRGVDVLVSISASSREGSAVQLLSNTRADQGEALRPGDDVHVWANEADVVSLNH